MVGTKSIIFIAALGLILARFGFLFKAFKSTEIFKDQFELDDVGCELAGMGVGMIGSEDMALGKYGILFISSGDLNQTFGYGPASANTGTVGQKIKISPDQKLVKSNKSMSRHFFFNIFQENQVKF